MIALLMQSEIQDLIVELCGCTIQDSYLRAFELFQEFSGRSVSEIIKERRLNFKRLSPEARLRLEKETLDFRNWLRDVKSLSNDAAHYYSISLKSSLAGLPMGIAVGLLFGIAIAEHTKNRQGSPDLT